MRPHACGHDTLPLCNTFNFIDRQAYWGIMLSPEADNYTTYYILVYY